MPAPKTAVDLLLFCQAVAIPGGRQQSFAGKHRPKFWMLQVFALELSKSHDVEQRSQWRTSQIDASVRKVMRRDALLRRDDVLHSLGKHRLVLRFRPQHFIGEHQMGMIEHAPTKSAHETRRD